MFDSMSLDKDLMSLGFLFLLPLLFLYGIVNSYRRNNVELFENTSNNELLSISVGLPPLDINDEYYVKPLRSMGHKAILHRVLLVRHGETYYNRMHDAVGDDTESLVPQDLNTPLTTIGIQQAQETAAYIQTMGFEPDEIWVSPLMRSVQTANAYTNNSDDNVFDGSYMNAKTKLMELLLEVNMVDTIPVQYPFNENHNNTFQYKKETYEHFISRCNLLKKTLEAASFTGSSQRKQTIVFTHSMVIAELLNALVHQDRVRKHTSGDIFWHIPNGSITCIDFTEGNEWHIHAVGYSAHLTNPTGCKMPLV